MLDLLGSLDPRAALAIHLSVVGAVVLAILAVAAGLRDRSRPGLGVYESGAPPGPPLRGRAGTSYFQIALFFMIFDVEVALLFGWAVAARALGHAGLIAAAVFIFVLLAALLWLWLDGALETAPADVEEE